MDNDWRFYTGDADYLAHHGIKGQKWGIRRFQNVDGTRTAAGKRREREGADSTSSTGAHNGGVDKKKVATGVAIAGTVALGAALLANPGTRNILTKYGKTTVTGIKDFATSDKTKEAVSKFGKNIGKRAERAGNAMLDAALVSVGGIAISKVNKKFADEEGDTEGTKAAKQITRDSINAGIRSATGSAGGNNGNKSWVDNRGTHVGQEISSKIGPPSNQNIDRSSKAWQDLFKDANGNQRDADTRSTIKSMANAGYDIEQIDRWLNHAEFADWINQYMAVEIGE